RSFHLYSGHKRKAPDNLHSVHLGLGGRMDDRAELRLRPLLLASALAVALLVMIGCNSPTPPPTIDTLNLQGLWQVTPAAGTAYGSGGSTTLEFGASKSGFAAF